jgi:hypothetical protein
MLENVKMRFRAKMALQIVQCQIGHNVTQCSKCSDTKKCNAKKYEDSP